MEGILKPGYLPGNGPQEDTGPSLHTYFMAYQEGQLSMEEFIEHIGGVECVPTPVLKLLASEGPVLSFAKFALAYNKTNSFAGLSAGGRTKYQDNAKAIIEDNSGELGETRIHGGNFKRTRTDISLDKFGGRSNSNLQNKQRRPLQRNDVSLANPLTQHMETVSTVGEQEELMQASVRMYLNGELQKRELLEYLSGIREQSMSDQMKAERMQKDWVRDAGDRKIAEILEKHEVNGPFNFRTLMQMLRGAVLPAE